VECFRYLGDLELAYLMVEKDIISFEFFKKQFGYRIENIRDNPSLSTYLYKNEKDYWTDLLKIIKMFPRT